MWGCKLKAKILKSPDTDILDSISSNATIGETFLSMWKKRASQSEAYALGFGQR